MSSEFGNQSKSYLSSLVKIALNGFKAFWYEKIVVDGTVKRLTVPATARYALMKIVSSATGNCAFYLEFLLPVTSTDGLPIADGTVFDVTDYANLQGFNITQSQAGTHTLYVQYYR